MANVGSKIVLEVEARQVIGKNACRRLRVEGKIPGNVYGLDRPPFMVAVSPKRIDELLRLGSGVNTIFALTLAGENRTREAMIKELQRDPISDRPIHVDFVRVDPNRLIHVRVPVRLLGIPVGVRLEGGIVDFVHREIHVECLPAAIPESVTLDIGELHLNQHVAVKDLALAEGVKVLDDPEQILAVVAAPKAEEVAEAVTAAATEEPEVIKKAKDSDAKEAAGKES